MKFIKQSGQIKWYVQTNYVDIHTGEEISKSDILNKKYRKINSRKKIQHEEGKAIITHIVECSKNPTIQKSWDWLRH